jgi:hypothetical protein
MDVVSVLWMQISNFPKNICWKGCLYSIVYFECPCQKSGGHSCMDSCLFLLLWLFSIVWSQKLWYLQHFSIALFAQYCLGYLRPFFLAYEIYGYFSNSVMNVIGILMSQFFVLLSLCIVFLFQFHCYLP